MHLDKTKLAAAFDRYGLDYRFVSGFSKRGHAFSSGAPKGAVCHHTAGAASGNYPSERVVTSGRPGLSGPLANVGLARDGTILGIASGLAYHAGVGSWRGLTSGNTWLVGIEAESTGKGDWTPSQISAYPRLLAALADAYGYSLTAWSIGHLEWAPHRKIDPHGWPGGMAGLRKTAAAVQTVENKPKPKPKPVTRPVPKPSRGGVVKARVTRKLVVDGKIGPATIRALQADLKVTVDGRYSTRTKVALQRRLKVTADGVVGPATVRALQRRLKVTADGSWGPKTTAALQRRLNAGTL